MAGLSVSEAAVELGLSRQRVVQLIGAGRLPAVRSVRQAQRVLEAIGQIRRPGASIARLSMAVRGHLA